VSDRLEPAPLPDGRDMPVAEWQQTPRSGRRVMRTLRTRLASLEARLPQDSSNSSRPPSTEAPEQKCQRRTKAADRRTPGAQPGHPGPPQGLLEPTATVSLLPPPCACGQYGGAELTPCHTPQVIALPVLRPEGTHWLRPHGRCLSWGQRCTAPSHRTRSVATVPG
jgi:transposase